MNHETRRLSRIQDQRIKREQLCQRRVAICQRVLTAAEARLTTLYKQQHLLRHSVGTLPAATIQWYQNRQLAFTALCRRIERTERLRQRLAQRTANKETELVRAAQMRRAAETALARLEQEAGQIVRRAEDKRFDDMVRTAQINGTLKANAATT